MNIRLQSCKYLLISVCASLLVAGCQNTSPQNTGPLQKITMAYTNQPESILIRIALYKGYFAKRGLEVQSQLHSYGRQALLSVLEGKADIATVAETPIILAIFRGEKIYIINNIFMSTENNAVIGRRDSGISSAKNLKGKRIAFVPGTTSEFFMDAFLQSTGISRKDITAVGLQPEQIVEALTSGKVDAAAIWNFELAYIGKELGNNGIAFTGKDIYTQTFNVAAQQEFVHKNPETIKKFLFALVDAEEFTRVHPDEAQAIVADSLKVSRETLREIWVKNTYTVSLTQALLVTLEDESRWAMSRGLTKGISMPNYLDYIYVDGLRAVKPAAIQLIH
jgi:ABC-type nitrate/sulfonate/bicarbonate transport system substrate-binding protein